MTKKVQEPNVIPYGTPLHGVGKQFRFTNSVFVLEEANKEPEAVKLTPSMLLESNDVLGEEFLESDLTFRITNPEELQGKSIIGTFVSGIWYHYIRLVFKFTFTCGQSSHPVH